MVRFARQVGQVGQKAQDAQGPFHVLILFPHESRIVEPFGGAPWKSPIGNPVEEPHGGASWESPMGELDAKLCGGALWESPMAYGLLVLLLTTTG